MDALSCRERGLARRFFDRFSWVCLAALGACLGAAAAQADPVFDVGSSQWSFVGGRGDPNLDMVGAAFAHVMGRWSAFDCDTFWEADLERWHGGDAGPARPDIVTPGGLYGCRFPELFGAARFAGELAVGARLLSHTSIAPDRDYSTAFQFQEAVGVRLALDPGGAWSFDARVRHVSNADIRRPNPGINAVLIGLGYSY